MLAITSIYVRYLLPMMIEIQWWDFKAAAPRRARVTHPELRYGAFAPQGWKLEYTGWSAAERVGAHEGASRSSPSSSATTTSGCTTTSRPCRAASPRTCSRRSRRSPRSRSTRDDQARPARHVRRVPQRRAARQGSRVRRRVLGRPADPRHRRGLVRARVPGVRHRRTRRAGARLQILEETLEVVKRLWTEETVTYQGKHLTFDGAYCDPKPIQQLPEIWVGGGGEKVTLRIAAQHADKTNWQVGLEGFVRKSEVLAQHCDEIGRDFDSIVRTHGPDCRRLRHRSRPRRRGSTRRRAASLRRASTPHDEYVRDNLVGTAEQVAEKVQAFVDAGCREFVLWFRDYPSTESLERFAKEVVPRCGVDRGTHDVRRRARAGSEFVLQAGVTLTRVTLTSDAPPRENAAPATRRGIGGRGIAAGVAIALGVLLFAYSRSDLWLDEALSVNIARLPLGDLRAALQARRRASAVLRAAARLDRRVRLRRRRRAIALRPCSVSGPLVACSVRGSPVVRDHGGRGSRSS